MFLGHFGIGFAAKRLAATVSLGTLLFAGQFLDILWPLFLLAGIERFEVVPGIMAASSFDFTYYPYSHSLLAAIAWAIVVGGVYFAARKNGGGAVIVAGAVFSHWPLDFLVHRPDLPLWPDHGPYFGLGAWHSIPLTLTLELGFLLGGFLIYLKTTRPKDSVGQYGPIGLVALLTFVYFVTLFGPPPTDETSVAVSGLGFFALTFGLGFWIDRHRGARA